MAKTQLILAAVRKNAQPAGQAAMSLRLVLWAWASCPGSALVLILPARCKPPPFAGPA